MDIRQMNTKFENAKRNLNAQRGIARGMEDDAMVEFTAAVGRIINDILTESQVQKVPKDTPKKEKT